MTTNNAPEAVTDAAAGAAPHPVFVVGVGASAGGLEALQRLFDGIRPSGRLAFVVVQHLSPDFKSVMGELLARHSNLAVRVVEDGTPVEPGTIYLMPAKKEMIISAGCLVLRDRDPSEGLSLPIDVFFRSLAEDQGLRSIAIVLSGSGSDGSRGIRAIHEVGGLVIAQTEDTAKFSGMPKSAIDTGVVDLMLAPESMAAALLKYAERDGEPGSAQKPELTGDQDTTQRLFELLRRESNVDFSAYKSSTVGRRIERRLLMSECQTLDDYVDRLEQNKGELGSLYRDLLIGVTRFFRDPDGFERLQRTALAPMIEAMPRSDELRIWVPGCATGEEAYSLAILAMEVAREKHRPLGLKIFATDAHKASLETASAGLYSFESLAPVPEHLRQRYFIPQSDGFRVTPELRAGVVFAHHNVLRDAPFTRVDLISCRNLLIFTAAAQRKVITLFHFGLKTGGVLFLGPSETASALAEEFLTVDQRWHIYRKRRDVRIAADIPVRSMMAPRTEWSARGRPSEEEQRVRAARDLLVQKFAPPSLLIDADLNLVHAFNGAGRYLIQRDGRPSLNVLELICTDLRVVLSAALKRVDQEPTPVIYPGLTVCEERLRLSVVPTEDLTRDEPAYLITLESEAVLEPAVPGEAPPSAALNDLAQERISGQELIASNEELQSTNEELHSVNEELYAVNAEYQAKIAELTELTADMNHLLDATQVAILFLDGELNVRKFTPKIGEIFNLLPQDVGRRLQGFSHNLLDEHVYTDLERVARTSQFVEREVQSTSGRSYLLRVLPYRTTSPGDGLVLTLVDISELKETQIELEKSGEQYRTLVRAVPAVLFTTDDGGRFVAPQEEWEVYTGQSWSEHPELAWLTALHPEDRLEIERPWREAVERHDLFEGSGRVFCVAHRAYRRCLVRAAPVRQRDGSVCEWVGNLVDVQDATAAEEELRKKTAQLGGILENSPALIYVKDLAGQYMMVNRRAEVLLGLMPEQMLGKTDFDLFPYAVAEARQRSDRQVVTTGQSLDVEETMQVGGEPRRLLSSKFVLRDETGHVVAAAGISSDISDRLHAAERDRMALQQRDRFMAMLSHELRTPLGAIFNASEILHRSDLRAESLARSRTVIRRQAHQMARLLDDLLDISRVTRNALTLHRRPCDLALVVNEAAEAARTQIEGKGLTFNLDLGDGPVPIDGDAMRLQQVVANLLSNGLKYTDKGAIDLVLRTEPGQGHGQAQLVLRDTGIGMTASELEHAFELFYQGPQSVDRPFGGLGVGLSLAREVIRNHGGQIHCKSEGKSMGSEFRITLPLRAFAGEPLGVQHTPGGRRRLRIALVEDSDDIRDTMQELLEAEGHEVLVRSDGEAGYRMIVEAAPDVALVDVGLPKLDGLDVARRVRAECSRRVRLIALTGYGRSEDRGASYQAGFDSHLVKPIDIDQLMRVLDTVPMDSGEPLEMLELTAAVHEVSAASR
jgi:two-component system CheB/CheR fusion protein